MCVVSLPTQLDCVTCLRLVGQFPNIRPGWSGVRRQYLQYTYMSECPTLSPAKVEIPLPTQRKVPSVCMPAVNRPTLGR